MKDCKNPINYRGYCSSDRRFGKFLANFVVVSIIAASLGLAAFAELQERKECLELAAQQFEYPEASARHFEILQCENYGITLR